MIWIVMFKRLARKMHFQFLESWRTSMPLPALDIFKRDPSGNPVWVDAVSDLEAARHRLSQLASALPGEYFAFDQRTHKILEIVAGVSSEAQL
jgi:hypothetical protein